MQLSREKIATNGGHHELHAVKVLNLTTGAQNIVLAVGEPYMRKHMSCFGERMS
jgi:hypothetical protein